jgi:hypothetical protein
MRQELTIAASLAAILLLCGASPDKVPEEVAAHMERMAHECKDVGGSPSSDKFAEHGILADGLKFWAINEGAFRCDGAASLFSGSGGSQVVVYLSLPDGHARQIFASGAYGFSVEHSEKFARLWIGVGGPLCGQRDNPTQADTINCDRPLTWNARGQRLDLAPLSQARIPGRLHNE